MRMNVHLINGIIAHAVHFVAAYTTRHSVQMGKSKCSTFTGHSQVVCQVDTLNVTSKLRLSRVQLYLAASLLYRQISAHHGLTLGPTQATERYLLSVENIHLVVFSG